jgi:tetratricopeptide (TPR) repeat protein
MLSRRALRMAATRIEGPITARVNVVQVTNALDSGSLKLNISLLLLGRPHLTHSISVAAYNVKMATIHSEPRKSKDDLSRFIREGIARRLQLQGATDDLAEHIQMTIETKAQGMFLWANLMLEILKHQTTEDDIRSSLDSAPLGTDDRITEILKVYSSILKRREAEEFNTILAWLACAARPLTLAEIDAVLRRLSPTAAKVLSLEQKLRDTYSSLLELLRDDGLSTWSLRSQSGSTTLESIPNTTQVVFTHASIAVYFHLGHGRFARRKTAIPIGVVRPEAELFLLKTCFAVFVSPGEQGWWESSKVLQSYAKEHWFRHLCGLQGLNLRTDTTLSLLNSSTAEQDSLLRLMFDFFSNESVIRVWCRDTPWSSYTEDTVATIAGMAAAWIDPNHIRLPAQIQQWTMTIKARPQELLRPIARVNALESLYGAWYPLPALQVVAQIKALIEDDDTLDTIPENSCEVLVKAARWFSLEENAVWNRKLAVCLRNALYTDKATEHLEAALKLNSDLVEARGELATVYEEKGYYNKVIELELTNIDIVNRKLSSEVQSAEDGNRLRKDLCRSHEAVANSSQEMGNVPMALRNWRKAAQTGEMADWTIIKYLNLLTECTEDSRWEHIIQLLQFLQAKPTITDQDRLTTYIFEEMWPVNLPQNFFFSAAIAAKETNNLKWLIVPTRVR